MNKEVKIPDIAENVESGLVASLLVEEGEHVKAEQPLVEIETDKATTEIPSDYEGKVAEIKVEQGDEVKVNQVIMIIDAEKNGSDKDDTKEAKEKEKPKSEKEQSESSKQIKDETKQDKPDAQEMRDQHKAVSPLAKRIAREHKVDISQVEGSGPGNRVSKNDVEAFISENKEDTGDTPEQQPTQHENAETLNNIGKVTAQTMQKAWQEIPHVTQFDEADITKLEKFRSKNKAIIEKQGGKLTITALLLKITAQALLKFPRFNASYDKENARVIYKNNINLNVAVDTSHGLMVPVVKNVVGKSMTELTKELSEIAKKAREKKLANEEMQGGTFTVSNLGGIGGTGFTPIVYPPQVAILGISQANYTQKWKDDSFKKRLVMPLSVSYDHRVINGADGARFLKWICDAIENPFSILL